MTKHTHPEDQPTDPPSPDRPEPEGGSDFVTRADLKADEKPSEPTKTVKLTSPAGSTVETSEENAQALRDQGYT